MRRVLAVLAVLAGTLTMGLATAPVTVVPAGAVTPTTTVYDSTTGPTPSSYIYSVGFDATQTSEIGNEISLGAGSRTLDSVVVTMSSWACQTGSWYNADCATSPGATYAMPLTLTLYSAGAGDTVGATLYSTTQSLAIPYRPAVDPTHCSAFADPAGGSVGGDFWDGTYCEAGLAANVTFSVPAITVPGNLIYGISYATTSTGAAPYTVGGNPCTSTGAGCFYDSLNVGLSSDPDNQSAGSNTVPDSFFQSSLWMGEYCDSGLSGVGSFRLDAGCWSAQNPNTQAEVPAGNPTGMGPASLTAPVEGLVPAVQFNAEAACTTDCYVSPTGNDAAAGNADSPFATIQHAVGSVASGGTVHVAAGTYTGQVHITQPLTLLGANAGTPATGTRGTESVIAVSPAPATNIEAVQISAPDVTVDGFTVQQTGTTTCTSCADFGVQVDPTASGATVTDDVVNGMAVSGTSPKTGNPIGIDVAGNNTNLPNGVTVSNNLVENVSSSGSQHVSALGIEVGDSTVLSSGTGLVISGNHVTGVSSQWGAYGIIFNRPTTGSHVLGNTIDTIQGTGWAHGIGLESNETSPVITHNAISGVVGSPTDSVDLLSDASNLGVATATVTDNSFGGGTAGGIGSLSAGTLAAAGNWWSCASGPNTAGCSATGGSGSITTSPWIVSYTADPAHAGQPGFWPTAVTSSAGPAFTSASSTTFYGGVAGSFTVAASGAPAPTLSEAGTDTLPAGVTFTPGTGVLAGTPTVPGSYTLHFTAHNGAGADATQTVTLHVDGISSAASIQTAQGRRLNVTVTSSGTPTAVIGSVGLPSWMTLKPGTRAKAGTAKLSGVGPVGGGTYTFTLTADYGGGHVASQVVTVHVLAISSVATASFSKTGLSTQQFTIATTGASGPLVITAALGSEEAGLVFHDNGDGTATITGIPAAGARTHLVRVVASAGGTAWEIQKLTVVVTP